MERNNGLGNEMELYWLIVCVEIFVRGIQPISEMWNDCVDLWSGMKKPLMPCGAEVGEMN